MNIIVVFTPFQAISAKAVIDSGVLCGEVHIFCFLRESDWARDLLGNDVEFLSGDTKLAGMRALRHFKKAVSKIVASSEKITAVIAHPFHPAANFLMFSNLVSRRYMMPDGIANYYRREIDLSFRRKMLLRKTAAALCGLSYRMYSGHIAGHETGLFDGVFTFQEKGMATKPGQVFTLKMSTSHCDSMPSKGSIMLLDQDVESLLPEKVADHLRRRLWDYIEGLDDEVIYYKGHYAQAARSASVSGKKIIELDKNIPAELLLEKICPARIISFVSSGLIHAKLILPNIHAISIGAAEIEAAKRTHVTGLQDMLKLFDVEMV